MVTNCFENRNFMQPMRRPKACTQGALLSLGKFFFIFPWFPMCSQYVPLRFPLCFHQVPQVSNEFSIAPHFHRTCFGKCCPLFIYVGGPKKKTKKLRRYGGMHCNIFLYPFKICEGYIFYIFNAFIYNF
jgi:hypothetical protein